MHIADGVLTISTSGRIVLGAGFALAGVGTWIGLARLDYERVPRVAMLSAAFFVVSLLNVPLGGTSIHPVLNGLIGLLLGWAAFPCLLVALALQAVFFMFGGLTTLGINTLNMALPAVVCHYLFRAGLRSDRLAFVAGVAAGFLGVVLAALLMAGSLLAAGQEFRLVSIWVVVTDLAVAVVEGLLTGSVLLFLRKVRPELLVAPVVPREAEPSHVFSS